MDKILERARKLLAMSQDASSEHEAMIAAKRLHALLIKHNIELTELERDEQGVDAELAHDGSSWPWKKVILGAVSELYFCSCYIAPTRKNYSNFFVVGTESNRLFAIHLIKNIFSIIERAARRGSVQVHGKPSSTYITSFRNGAAARVSSRCAELLRQAETGNLKDEDGTQLPALANVYKLNIDNAENWIIDNLRGCKSVRPRMSYYDKAGYSDGLEAGNQVQLSRALQADQSPKLIG